jgi:hypothetical protein
MVKHRQNTWSTIIKKHGQQSSTIVLVVLLVLLVLLVLRVLRVLLVLLVLLVLPVLRTTSNTSVRLLGNTYALPGFFVDDDQHPYASLGKLTCIVIRVLFVLLVLLVLNTSTTNTTNMIPA